MEISTALNSRCSITRFNYLQLPLLSPQSHPNRRPLCRPKCQSHSKHRLNSSLPTASKSRPSLQQRLTVNCSDTDGNASVDSATKPAEADSSVEVKRKAAEIANDLKGTSIYLVGMNCSMKTGIGKVISEALRYYYFDSDSLAEEYRLAVEAEAGGRDDSDKSFRERDADGFNEAETEILKQLSSIGRLVVTAGNGAVQSSTNLALLRHGICLWIDVPLDLIAKERIQKGNGNTTSNGSPESSSEVLTRLAAVYEENRGGYAIADATISLQKVASKLARDEYEQVTIEDMALEILHEIERLTRSKKMMQEAAKLF